MMVLPGVFQPISDSWMLAEHVEAVSGPGVEVLDLCTGSGVVGVTAALAGADVTAIDVSRRAVTTARLNGWVRGRRVRARRGHLFDPVAGRRFDIIASNPPYVPSSSSELPKAGITRAWRAGPDGRLVLDRICDHAARHLRPGGVLLLVHSTIIGEQQTLDRLLGGGFADAAVVDRSTGPLGPLMLEQRSLGNIPAHIDHEDVIVVRAVAA